MYKLHMNGITWEQISTNYGVPELLDLIGFIPSFFHEHDHRPAAEQIMESYIGGWNNFKGFTLDTSTMTLKYPDDPDMHPFIVATLPTQEKVYVYPYAWVMVLQPDGETFEVDRLD